VPARPEADARSAREVPRSPLAAITVSALLVLVGTAWLLDATGAVDVDLGVVAASALALIGLALLVSAWYGRARRLIVLGIPLLVLVAALGLVDVPLHGGIGDPSYAPHRLADVQRKYELAVGDLTVDLRRVDFSGVHRTVRAQVGIGRLNIVVPPGARVVVDGHSGVGDVVVFGNRTKECCPTDVHRVQQGIAGDGTLHLVARVGAGHVEVKTEEDHRGAS
jgi:predicted membrane protein